MSNEAICAIEDEQRQKIINLCINYINCNTNLAIKTS